jgi:hypothetical protein
VTGVQTCALPILMDPWIMIWFGLSVGFVGFLCGFVLGFCAIYKMFKAEMYEYIKASRRDQEMINQLLKEK